MERTIVSNVFEVPPHGRTTTKIMTNNSLSFHHSRRSSSRRIHSERCTGYPKMEPYHRHHRHQPASVFPSRAVLLVTVAVVASVSLVAGFVVRH